MFSYVFRKTIRVGLEYILRDVSPLTYHLKQDILPGNFTNRGYVCLTRSVSAVLVLRRELYQIKDLS